MYEYQQVIYRMRSGQSLRSIAKDTGFGRNTLKRLKATADAEGWLAACASLPTESAIQIALANETTPPAPRQRSAVLAHESQVKQWVEEGISAKTIHRFLVETHGFSGSYHSVQRLAQKIKRASVNTLTVPLVYQPGEAAQIDFGKGPDLYDRRVERVMPTWFFVMTLCWSRHQYAELVTHQSIETWLHCHQHAFEWFDGVPKKLIIDNPKCAITKACYHSPEVQRSYEALAQAYHFIISACPPREPKKKGRVESGVKYLKRAFVPLQTFDSLQDANQALKHWIRSVAGNRQHGTTFEKPLTRFVEIESHQLTPLPETKPALASWHQVKLYRDCHVRYDNSRYSAPYQYYDKPLWLKISETQVAIYYEETCVAQHARLFKAGQWSSKQEHFPPKAKAYLQQDAAWCLAQSQYIGQACHFVIENALTHPTKDLLRQAQRILALQKKYGRHRLESACQRAKHFNAMNYKTINTILQEGLDHETLTSERQEQALATIYQGQARYQRTPNSSIH